MYHNNVFVVSITNIGQMLGSVLGGYLANAIGRKHTILAMNTFGTVGWAVISMSFDYVSIISLGRFLCGFGIVTSTIQVRKR
jgi:MFS family permease